MPSIEFTRCLQNSNLPSIKCMYVQRLVRSPRPLILRAATPPLPSTLQNIQRKAPWAPQATTRASKRLDSGEEGKREKRRGVSVRAHVREVSALRRRMLPCWPFSPSCTSSRKDCSLLPIVSVSAVSTLSPRPFHSKSQGLDKSVTPEPVVEIRLGGYPGRWFALRKAIRPAKARQSDFRPLLLSNFFLSTEKSSMQAKKSSAALEYQTFASQSQ